jgi:hypothetical protein
MKAQPDCCSLMSGFGRMDGMVWTLDGEVVLFLWSGHASYLDQFGVNEDHSVDLKHGDSLLTLSPGSLLVFVIGSGY